ncbi:hypothetical protein Tco_0739982 [Tanacetum coccineum]
MAKKSSIPAVDLSADDDNIEDEEDDCEQTDKKARLKPSGVRHVTRESYCARFGSEFSRTDPRRYSDQMPKTSTTRVKTRPAKSTKIKKQLIASAGSGSGSKNDVLNEELRQKIQDGKSTYEAKKVKEQSATELNELQFLTIDADSLAEPKKTIIKNKQAQIMAKYQL